MINLYEDEQPIASRIIRNSILNDRCAHAYIIETNGYENGYSFALSLAKLILCNNNEQCEKCYQCKQIDEDNYPELKIINPDGNWIKKEQLTDLQEEFSKKSVIGNKKVYIINKAEKLNSSSANTILKFLEEPEEGITAILVTNNAYQILQTIKSRCQIISLNGQVIKGKNIIEKLALLFTDNEIDYSEFINDENNLEKIEQIFKFINMLEKSKNKTIIYTNSYVFEIFKEKDNIQWFINIMIYIYKDILNYKLNKKIEIFEEYVEQIDKISENNSIEKLMNKISILNETRKYLDINANLNLLIDRMIIEMAGE